MTHAHASPICGLPAAWVPTPVPVRIHVLSGSRRPKRGCEREFTFAFTFWAARAAQNVNANVNSRFHSRFGRLAPLKT